MKKLISLLFVAPMGLPASQWAHANEFSDLRTKLSAARESLVNMLTNKEKRGADQQKVVKETADAVSAHLAKLKAPAGKEAQFNSLVENWNAFKKTRENELVPAILRPFNRLSRSIAPGNRLRTPCKPWISCPRWRFTMKIQRRRAHSATTGAAGAGLPIGKSATPPQPFTN